VPAALQSTDLDALQDQLDFLLPRKPLLRADEVAKALGCDERTVHRLFEDGQLCGHELNAAKGQRQHRRYRRDAVILYLARTANYAAGDIPARVLEVIANLPTSDKARIYHATGKMLLS